MDVVLMAPWLVVQELGREGVLPFSSFFASNKPFNAPLAGLFEQWFVTSSLVLRRSGLMRLCVQSHPLPPSRVQSTWRCSRSVSYSLVVYKSPYTAEVQAMPTDIRRRHRD